MTLDALRPKLGGTERGRVETFDAEKGLGVLITALGDWYPFHCTAIIDGSRHIDVGQEVTFVVGPGGPGRWEAHQVVPLPPSGD